MKARAQVFIFIFFFFLYSVLPQFSYASDITSNWLTALNVPFTVSSHSVIAFNKNIFIIGGANTDDFPFVFYSSSGDNGYLQPWQVNNFLPQTRYWSATSQKDNYVYILGGAMYDGAVHYKNTVMIGSIDDLNKISWNNSSSSLPKSLGLGASAIIQNRIYFSGGFNNGEVNKYVYEASINPDGSLGSWTPVGEMPEPRLGHSMLAYKGHIIILGGDNLSTVYVATPDQNGLISSWQQTSSFPTPMYRASMQVVGNTIISVGGSDGSSTIDKVYYATIHDDGTIDPWQLSSNHLPSPVHAGGAAIVGDYLYLIGGYNSITGSYLNSVYYTKLNTSSDISLNVPLIKQTDPQWGNLEYDSAYVWDPLHPGIDYSGCALTSAAMVFQYNGITKLPDGTNLDPGTLNSWLKNYPKGYIGGYVNWIALQKLSKLAKLQNPLFSFDALEYKRINSYNPFQLKADLTNNIPDILEEPNHFIVVTGTKGDTFAINDPYFSRTSLADYNNTFLKVGRFVPSNSDLSYLEFAVDEGVTITVKDDNGNPVGQGFLQEPVSPDGESTNRPLFFYYVQQPENSHYTITITSDAPKKYVLQSLLYDQDGNLVSKDTTGIVDNSSQDSFSISFNKNGNTDADVVNDVSIESFISDLDLLYSQQLLGKGPYMSLEAKILNTEKNNNSSNAILNSILIELDSQRSKGVSEDAYQILYPETTQLLSSL